MTTRSFSIADQTAFATLSGDFNPLHIDAVAARRLMFGRPVVHGIHLLLWALDTALERGGRLTALKVTFKSPVGVDEAVTCGGAQRTGTGLRITLDLAGRPATVIDAALADAAPAPADAPTDALALPDRDPPRSECRVLAADALPEAAGTLELMLGCDRLRALFPRLAGLLPPDQIAFLLATTRLVGMECPGLHSLYSALSLKFAAPEAGAALRLGWRVRRYDSRTSYAEISAEGAGASGQITAFLRPAPCRQDSFAALKRHVAADAYAGRRALVVGGSRGLGEVCAKLLAAGGADVRLTYFRGARDAEAVAAEIAAGGGRAEARFLNVLAPGEDLAAALGPDWRPSHLYYFATPPIFIAARKKFSAELFSAFSAYYVTGFTGLVKALEAAADGPLSVFYPSSTAVDDPPLDMGEYAAAKAAGEMAARFLAACNSKLTMLIRRLPRMPTDQTATLFAVDAADPVPLLLDIL